MKINRIILLAFGLALLFSGCSKEKNTPPTVYADSFVKSMYVNNRVVYNVLHYITSTSAMTSCKVQTPTSQNITLLKYDSQGTSFYLEPDSASYTTIPPPAGDYVYTATFTNGSVKTYTNTVLNSILAPPVITSLAQSVDKQSVALAWNAVTGADGYTIRLWNGTNNIYTYPAFANTGGQATIQVNIPINLFGSSLPGTFKVEVIALLFESSAYNLLQAQGANVQSVYVSY